MRIVELGVTGCLALASIAATATITEVFGGPGGGPFSLSCGSGRYLVGFDAAAGAWLDGLALICAPLGSDAKVGSPSTRSRWTGGRGGTRQEVYCPPGQAITALGLAHTRGGGLPRQYVNTIDIRCQHRPDRAGCISTGEGCGPLNPSVKGVFVQKGVHYQYDVPSCPAGEYATGVQGRSGNYVDALGLVCSPIADPVAVATSRPEKKVEVDFDRPGGDYRSFDLAARASPAVCRAACEGDGRCKTYSYVKPGIQGPQARCWLKDRIPPIRRNDCCVSGVIRTSAVDHPVVIAG